MMLSGLMVAFAPNTAVFMAGRALVGVVVGGFWSMSAATVMRLVPDDQVPKALGLLNGGNALATTIAAPLGSYLGQFIGWRGAFFIVVPLAALTFFWQYLTLPSMPGEAQRRSGAVFRVLRRPHAPAAFAAMAALFLGQFALFTYLRPFLETVTRVNVSTLSLLLLGLGAAGLLGTYLIGILLRRTLYPLLIGAPLVLAGTALALIAFGTSALAAGFLLAAWGLISTAAPVAWWTWLAKALPDDAEAGGGLMVAVVQLAITLGAAVGGLLVDASGYEAAFGASAAVLAVSAGLGYLARDLSPGRASAGGVAASRESCCSTAGRGPSLAL